MRDSNQTMPQPKADDPLDRAISQLQAFVERMEKQRARAEEQTRVSDDIPRFVTRYTP